MSEITHARLEFWQDTAPYKSAKSTRPGSDKRETAPHRPTNSLSLQPAQLGQRAGGINMYDLLGNQERFAFDVPVLDEELRVIGFSATETLSRPFFVELELASEDADLDVASIINQPALLSVQGEEDAPRLFHGIVSEFAQADAAGRFSRYRAVLVPALWRLGQRSNCRIFQDRTVPEIVAAVLEDAGIDQDAYRFVLHNDHPKHEYRVQYRETDLDFISRLLEEEGTWYHFEHDLARHTLIMTDAPTGPNTIAGRGELLFRPPGGGVPSEEHVSTFHSHARVRSGAVVRRDFDFKRPALNMEVSAMAKSNRELERFDYPGRYVEPKAGKALADTRLQETRSDVQEGTGESDCVRFAPGYRFALDDHPSQALNRFHLLTRVEHAGRQPQVLEELSTEAGPSYYNTFHCIPDDRPYRAASTTQKPVVDGVQSAIVVGPEGEEIYTDEYGRVKVQFHWDRYGKSNEHSSCWMRVSQLWAGAGWGAVHLPRIGHEVLVDFLEGDPDQPIVTGRVYHGTNRPPYKLPEHKTRSTIKSNSSMGGGGFNEFRFEDKKGEEQLFIHAERNQDVRVKHDSFETIGNIRHLIVERDQVEEVKGDKHLTVKGDQREQVEGNISLTLSGDQLSSVNGGVHLTVSGDHIELANGDRHIRAKGNLVLEASGLSFKVGGSFLSIGPEGIAINGPTVRINSGGSAGYLAAPSGPDMPIQPQEADNGVAMPKATVAKRQPTKAPWYSPAARVLKQAAVTGQPFCEQCEKAKPPAASNAESSPSRESGRYDKEDENYHVYDVVSEI